MKSVVSHSGEEVQSTTKVSVKLNLSSVSMKKRKGECLNRCFPSSQVSVKLRSGNSEVFNIGLSSLSTSVDVNSWDTTIHASLHSITVYDHYQLPSGI